MVLTGVFPTLIKNWSNFAMSKSSLNKYILVGELVNKYFQCVNQAAPARYNKITSLQIYPPQQYSQKVLSKRVSSNTNKLTSRQYTWFFK